jgi:hypothetical protein
MPRVRRRLLILLFTLYSSIVYPAMAQDPGAGAACSFMASDTLTLRKDWKIPLLKSKGTPSSILLYSSEDPANKDNELNVNSDGSPRAYHLLDPEGRNFALDDMPSGGVRVWDNDDEIVLRTEGLKKDEVAALRTHYYEVFARFVRENGNFGVAPSTYDPRNDPAYKVGDDFGNKLDPPPPALFSVITESVRGFAGSFFSREAIEPLKEKPAAAPEALTDYNCLSCVQTKCKVCFRKRIVKFKAGKLCIRASGRYKGFLVNETGLDAQAANAPDPENADDLTCDTPVNLDPEKLPGFVLPGGVIHPDSDAKLVAATGDVVIGFNPKSGKWAFGIVSDGGPAGKLGEASIAFNRTLGLGYQQGAKFPRPVTYHGDLLTRTYQPLRPISLLFLAGSKERFRKAGTTGDDHAFDFSPEMVARTAKAAFLEWAGTTDLDAARDKFSRCLSLLPGK